MPTRANNQAIHIFKFGGTSVATPKRMKRAVELVQDEPASARRVVIVSALGGVTDQLLDAIDAALERNGEHEQILATLRQRHLDAVEALATEDDRSALCDELEARWEALNELIDGVYLLRECTARTRDAVMSLGERASAPLLAAAFRAAGTDATTLDAHRLIRTDDSFGAANVQFDVTRELLQERFQNLLPTQVAVFPGFIGATAQDVTTTLGRSGSDYTATVLASSLDAERVLIWTDVDGVLSADPEYVDDAAPLPQLSYREAGELSYFGARVLHPRTMRPLEEKKIPLQIKNTFRPDAPGTLITEEVREPEGHVKAITSVHEVAVVMLEGAGVLGVPIISARAFNALAMAQIDVLMVSQASSAQNICLVVHESDAEAADRALHSAFELELDRGDMSQIWTQTDCGIVSAVGENMRQRTGLAGHMFSTLGRSGVNVLAIGQGAAETNISAVVRGDDARAAVQSLHEAFALGRHRAHVFLIGTGVVGSRLLKMLERQAPVLLDRLNLNLRLVGLANTRKMVWDTDGIAFADAKAHLRDEGRPTDLDTILEHLAHSRLDRLIVVDATASNTVARRYPDLLAANVAVVTPNKRANTRPKEFYDRLQSAVRRHQVPYLYETTVGAGLPVISTLRSLLDSGDRIERIEGVFSGTLAFIFNSLADGRSFSEAVRTARKKGYTEPDPRDDLNGEDVARKLLILAREMDRPVDRADVQVESLVPERLADVPVKRFMEQLDNEDASWKQRIAEAQDAGKRLQYVGAITPDKLKVGVRTVRTDSPFARLSGTDNMVIYTTERYHENPLVIQGPGAGPEVTAAGILADLIKTAELVT